MVRMTAGEARKNFSKTLTRVRGKQDRVVLRHRGKDIAAIVPMEDLAALEELEDRRDAEAAFQALAEMEQQGEKPIPYEQVRRKLGLK